MLERVALAMAPVRKLKEQNNSFAERFSDSKFIAKFFLVDFSYV